MNNEEYEFRVIDQDAVSKGRKKRLRLSSVVNDYYMLELLDYQFHLPKEIWLLFRFSNAPANLSFYDGMGAKDFDDLVEFIIKNTKNQYEKFLSENDIYTEQHLTDSIEFLHIISAVCGSYGNETLIQLEPMIDRCTVFMGYDNDEYRLSEPYPAWMQRCRFGFDFSELNGLTGAESLIDFISPLRLELINYKDAMINEFGENAFVMFLGFMNELQDMISQNPEVKWEVIVIDKETKNEHIKNS